MIIAEAQDLIKSAEGLHRRGKDGLIYPYMCPAGYPTVGWGHVVPSMAFPPITVEACELLFQSDINRFERGVLRLCPVLAAHPYKLGAITSFAFNLGLGRLQASTLRRAIAAKDWEWAVRELRRWNKGRNPKTGLLEALPGLVIRREAEAQLFMRD
jgi:lysozyme